jgi:hypothetical protein
MEVSNSREMSDVCFWVEGGAEMWHEGADGTEAWVETVDLEERHSLGPNRRVRRIG